MPNEDKADVGSEQTDSSTESCSRKWLQVVLEEVVFKDEGSWRGLRGMEKRKKKKQKK